MITAFIIVSVVLMMAPFLIWFGRNIVRAKNPKGYDHRFNVATKWSFIICVPLSLIFVALVITFVSQGIGI